MVEQQKGEATLNSKLGRHHAFRDLLSYQDRTFLVQKGRVRNLKPGEVLCQQDQLEDILYIILTGEMEVVEKVENKEIAIGNLSTGDLVGEIGALFNVPRIASVVAKAPTAVLAIRPKDFSSLMTKTPLLQSCVYQQLYERSLQTALRATPLFDEGKAGSVPDLSRMLSCWKTSEVN